MELQSWQKLRRLVLFLFSILAFSILILGKSHWLSNHFMHELYEAIGLVLILVCIVGRTWCSLYIAGRKKQELVAIGPYSIMRNPLYTFSFIGAMGVGLQFGAVTTGVLSFVIAWAVFSFIVIREEAFLRGEFGETYEAYLNRVPRFCPKVSLWTSPQFIEVYPKLVWRTFMDALVFLISIPLLELIEEWQEVGMIPTYFMFY